jgi:hypothetical protein
MTSYDDENFSSVQKNHGIIESTEGILNDLNDLKMKMTESEQLNWMKMNYQKL